MTQAVEFLSVPEDADLVRINNFAYAESAIGYQLRTDAITIAYPFHDSFVPALPHNKRVLDIGCGTGRDLVTMLDADLHPFGLEPCREMRTLAKRRLAEFVKQQADPTGYLFQKGYEGRTVNDVINGMVISGTMQALPVGKRREFDEESYDGLWAVTSLQHLPAELLPQFLVEGRELLVPGGLLYVKTRAPFDGQTRDQYACLQTSHENGRDFTRFFQYYDPQEFLDILVRHGFEILRHSEEDGRIQYRSIVNGVQGYKFWVLAKK